ncbi:hypothetical protein BGW38_004042 [Lunasporangiospora selenospora]|uniref:S-formylglutathione hydrolase n=1 Tax=Lunasporangiospora selenospora TaxID=979761 RepID=A0A9P6FQM0_9FUNG|nr:hypothetical protein BGW38_004042 [Lunasporangiospora selenospora]
MTLTVVSSSKHFGGKLTKYSHPSTATQCDMVFNVFLPKIAAEDNVKVPVLYCLGGLTSTEDNFAIKAGAAMRASQYGLALVFPDTSPRNVGFPEAGVDQEVGYSAGFYLNATQTPWDKNFKMYDYIAKELPSLVAANLPIGGHGAMSIFLKNQESYKSVSAFAPILHPSVSHWGLHAFPKYLGEDRSTWKEYDTIELIKHYASEGKLRKDVTFLIDQGTGDVFYKDRLNTMDLVHAVKDLGIEDQFVVRHQDGYDHGYFFISTFVNDHIDHHAKYLGLSLN